MQPEVVVALRAHGQEVYDFRNPCPGNTGFAWSDIDPDWGGWSPNAFIKCLAHPIAQQGFQLDFDAMKHADACVIVQPCGRSAHLEAGWFIGAGKPVVVLLAGGEPELMYNMFTELCTNVPELLNIIRSWKHTMPSASL